jgi:acyl carrier protein
MSTLKKIQETFHETFGVSINSVNENTDIHNLNEWDSLKHLQLIMNIEKKFSVKFEMAEIILINSVIGIKNALESKGKTID